MSENINMVDALYKTIYNQDQRITELEQELKLCQKLHNELFLSYEKLKDKNEELEEQLKNAIVLPIPLGEKCWTINCWCEYGDAKKGEPYVVTRYELHENIVSGYDIYKNMMNNELILNVVIRGKEHYKGVQPYLFATKEEAQAKLEELKGEKK